MGFRDRLKKKQKSFQKKGGPGGKKKRSGGRYPTIFLKDKIPEGVSFYQCKEGEHLVDILPWEVGPDMPHDDQGSPFTEEGEFDYVLDIFVHQNVGTMGQPYVCPYENFGLECPICEYIKANRLPKEEWSKVRAKRRSIYLVWDHTDAQTEKKGVQIFDAAHFFMEEKLEEIARLPKDGGSIMFYDPDQDGKQVSWVRKGAGAKDTRYLGHKFIDRDRPIPDKILDQTFALDQVVNMHPSYEEIEKAFYGGRKAAEGKEPDPDDNDWNGEGGDDKQDREDSGRNRKRTTSRKPGGKPAGKPAPGKTGGKPSFKKRFKRG